MASTVTQRLQSQSRSSRLNVPFPKGRIATPEEDGQANHKEGVRAQVRSNSKVAVEGRRAQLILHPSQVRRLPSDQRQRLLAHLIPPLGQRSLVCIILRRRQQRSTCLCLEIYMRVSGIAYNGHGCGGQHQGHQRPVAHLWCRRSWRRPGNVGSAWGDYRAN
jgi:hypothetical protein